jgi:hypothetical protein
MIRASCAGEVSGRQSCYDEGVQVAPAQHQRMLDGMGSPLTEPHPRGSPPWCQVRRNH